MAGAAVPKEASDLAGTTRCCPEVPSMATQQSRARTLDGRAQGGPRTRTRSPPEGDRNGTLAAPESAIRVGRAATERRARTTDRPRPRGVPNGTYACAPWGQATGRVEPDVRVPSGLRPTRRSGVLGGQSRFAARPLGWSDLNRLLEQAGAPAPCQISIPKPVFGATLRHRGRCTFRDTFAPTTESVVLGVIVAASVMVLH